MSGFICYFFYHQETMFCSSVPWHYWKPDFEIPDFDFQCNGPTPQCYSRRTIILCSIQVMIHKLDKRPILIFELKKKERYKQYLQSIWKCFNAGMSYFPIFTNTLIVKSWKSLFLQNIVYFLSETYNLKKSICMFKNRNKLYII